jgi:periplasmic divalent cation tolerance protein
MIVVYVTCSDIEEGKKISKMLLKSRLIACANIMQASSVYRWKGKITDSEECILLLKTSEDKFDAIEAEIKKIHSYDVPCIVSFKIYRGNKDYLDWVLQECE